MTHFHNIFRYDYKIQYDWNFKYFNFLWQYFMTGANDVNIEIEYKKITSTTEVGYNTLYNLIYLYIYEYIYI